MTPRVVARECAPVAIARPVLPLISFILLFYRCSVVRTGRTLDLYYAALTLR